MTDAPKIRNSAIPTDKQIEERAAVAGKPPPDTTPISYKRWNRAVAQATDCARLRDFSGLTDRLENVAHQMAGAAMNRDEFSQVVKSILVNAANRLGVPPVSLHNEYMAYRRNREIWPEGKPTILTVPR